MSITIKKIKAIEILDSRGYPTIECSVMLTNNVIGTFSVPSGASVGDFEATELRDNNLSRFKGKGVLKAIKNIHDIIQPKLLGSDPFNQEQIDQILIELDDSKQKNNLGANAILAVSMANAKAAANAMQTPLYKYIGGDSAVILPMPMMNILNGGAHANNSVDIQEIMVVPYKAQTFIEAVEINFNIYQELRSILIKQNKSTSIGDEGGFAPDFKSNYQAMQTVTQAIEKAGYRPGKDVFLALDIAASELYTQNKYLLKSENKKFNTEMWCEEIVQWSKKFPIISIEDPFDQQDHNGWQLITEKIGNKIQIVGDDIFVTNHVLLKQAYENNIANSILIKPNQIGTLTETLTTISYAKNFNYRVIISHRSGETADSSIADIAVATRAGQIKAGAPCRSDRVEKYNQLIRIEQQLHNKSIFMTGQSIYQK